jgi:hypothetical protein
MFTYYKDQPTKTLGFFLHITTSGLAHNELLLFCLVFVSIKLGHVVLYFVSLMVEVLQVGASEN